MVACWLDRRDRHDRRDRRDHRGPCDRRDRSDRRTRRNGFTADMLLYEPIRTQVDIQYHAKQQKTTQQVTPQKQNR